MRKLDPDLYIGLVYGRLTVMSASSFEGRKGWVMSCFCSCGTPCDVRLSNLKSGKTQSCGCLNREVTLQHSLKHGKSKSPLHSVWWAMIERCSNPKSKAYKNYGGRGIVVCERWLKFSAFYEDMGERPRGGTLERIDNNGPYSKENCIWASHKIQNRNRRDNRKITINGETRCLAEWCEVYGQNYKRAYQRIFQRGWEAEIALKTGALSRSYTRPRP